MNFAMSDIIIKYKLKRILNYTNVNQYSPTAQIAFIDSSIFGNPLFFKNYHWFLSSSVYCSTTVIHCTAKKQIVYCN